MGYETPTPIQEAAIPRVLAGRDVVGSAQTGTGKTAAFVLPILQRMTGPTVADGRTAHPSALVVTPTRELCGQIEEVGETLSTYSGRTVVAVFGGVPYDPQMVAVKRLHILKAFNQRLATLEEMRTDRAVVDRMWFAPRAHGHEFYFGIYDQMIRNPDPGTLVWPEGTE